MYPSTSAVEAKSHPVKARHWVLPNSASNHSLSSWPRFMTRLNALRSSAKASPRTAIVAIIRATRTWLSSISPSAKPSAITPAANALHVMPVKSVPPTKAVTASLSSSSGAGAVAHSDNTASAQWNARSFQCSYSRR